MAFGCSMTCGCHGCDAVLKASCCKHAGIGINTLNLETMSLEEVSKAVAESAGFVIGSPTLGGHMPTQVTCQCLSRTSVPDHCTLA